MPLLMDFDDLLCCPKCRACLNTARDTFGHCSSVSCPACGTSFPVIADQPALVDFESSVVDAASLTRRAGASTIDRTSSAAKDVFRRIRSGRPATLGNAATFVSEIKRYTGSPIVLVIGGGSIGYGADPLYRESGVRIIGFDIYASPHTSMIADAHRIPLRDGSVDGVWIQAVLEHVLSPHEVAAEIHRVLKPNGLVYAETPFLQPVHEGAMDFTRFTESGHRWLFRSFDRIDSGVVQGPGSSLLWAVRSVVSGVLRSRRAGFLTIPLLWWLRLLDRFTPASFAVDAACGVWFLGRRSETPITPKQAVAHYLGAAK